MGLRAASVRHPNAVVMAPALTEAGQSKNFTQLHPPSSPINTSVQQHNHHSHHQQQNNKNNDDEIQINVIKQRAYTNVTNATKYLTDTITPTIKTKLSSSSSSSPRGGVDVDASEDNTLIMSTCPTSMGDQDTTTMGCLQNLQKITGMDAAMTSLLLKDKTNITNNDVELLLNNLNSDTTATTTTPTPSSATQNVEENVEDLTTQNVEDLMQAWNNANMESTTTTTTNDAALSNVQGNLSNETIFPISFDRELFSDVDMMTICSAAAAGDADDEVDGHLCHPAQNTADKELKELRANEMLDDLHKKQLKLERRTEFILRRIRKLQIRHMGYHCSSEVAGLYEYVHRTLRRVCAKDTSNEINETSTTSSLNTLNNDLNLPEFPSSSSANVVEPVTTTSVNNLVRKLHLSSMQQSNVLHRQKYTAKYFGSGSTEQLVPIPMRHPAQGTVVVPRFAHDVRDEIERVSGTLQTELKSVEMQIDSDATASSSGAESCDEMQTYNNQHQNFVSINKRAAWRYANERAQVASRWTWLQAQISDLEYRIRQYNDLHRQIRSSKGAVTLGDHHSHRTTSSLSAASSPMSPSAVNGYRGQLPGATTTTTTITSSSSSTTGSSNNKYSSEDLLANGAVGGGASCSRTRPLHRTTFRKRKLLQTTGLHTVSKKASRPSNIRCGCVPPTVPCALCTGRTDPTFPRDCAEQLTVPERIALLDPGFHPVLSFPDDISQSIHLEAIMKLPDWQQKSLRCNLKSLKGMVKADRSEKALLGGVDRPKKSSEHRKKYNNRHIKSELKNKMGRGRRSFRGVSGFRIKKRHTAKMAMAQLNALASESMDELEMEAISSGLGVGAGGTTTTTTTTTGKGGSGVGGIDSSLTPSPLSHVQVVPYHRRNRSVDSYDIDNIVIPYSVAASTRVEKLQYKEILTPKWRVIDCDFPAKYDTKNNGIVRRVSEDSDVEDVTEETISSRHDKCEHEEKKKFLSYIKFPLTGAGRSRANRRTDSRAESSGANTPDPMSPHTVENSTETAISSSPITSPPATPVSMLNNNEDSSTNTSTTTTTINAISNANALRRRTVSTSRWAAHNREESRCITPDNMMEVIPPYEPRAFPINEDLYEKMLKSMPEGHSFPGLILNNKQSSRDSSDVTADNTNTQFPDDNNSNSRAVTPVSDSTESAIAEEDPNDPEWIDVERVRDRAKR